MEALIVFFGLSSFAITGTDDLLVLILFYIAFKSKFKEVIVGTLLGLLAVMVPSFVFAKTIAFFNVGKYIPQEVLQWIPNNLVLSLVLGYIAYNLLKDGFSEGEDDDIEDLSEKTSAQVIMMSGVTYFLNGLDDFVVYSGFYLKYETFYEIALFSFGIILGLMVFAVIAAKAGKIFLEFERKFQDKIKIVVGGIVLFAAIGLLFT